MIKIIGTLTKIENKQSKSGKNYAMGCILSPSMDQIYAVTDYDGYLQRGHQNTLIEMPVRISTSKAGYLNIVASGLTVQVIENKGIEKKAS